MRDSRRWGYAWGTLDDSPVVGEELFAVEWREDDAVYAVVRSVTRVSAGRFSVLLTPVLRFRQWMMRRQYVRALLPARAV
jgi:uncharacterized protein (UPF0548 family)